MYPTLHAGLEPYPGVRLLRFLGSGGFAEVWEADLGRGEPVALKFMTCDGGRAAQVEIRNLQAVRQIRHPGLVRADQIWSYRNFLVIAMELAECTLADVLARHQEEFGTALGPGDACDLLGPIGDVLDYLNSRQHRVNDQLIALQHCDVKPSNLLVFGNRVKLADFGLSAQTTGTMHAHRRAGTPDYAPPEVFQGRLSDRTDQYALAVTYYQLRTGRLPFADTPPTFQRSYVRPRPDLEPLESWERPILRRALAPTPQSRWPSCTELFDELTQVSGIFA